MLVFETIHSLRQYLKEIRTHETEIGFVPTMGCLHQGHGALIQRSVAENQVTVLSIFLNPNQFNRPEDYANYPRTFEQDLRIAEQAGATVVFAPKSSEMYPPGFQTQIHVQALSQPLCGISRPGHFVGMATVVLKLFHLVQPDRAYFGQKDYQQVCIVRQMVQDLNLDIQIVSCDTIRETNGLACSSRNARLSEAEQEKAATVMETLRSGAEAVEKGIHTTEQMIGLTTQLKQQLEGASLQVEYVEIVDAQTLRPMHVNSKDLVIAAAVLLNGVRLIDNILIPHGLQ